MGGLVCNIHAQAILRYQTVPTTPPEEAEFDAQMRELYNWVAQDVVNDTDKGPAVCAILAKPSFTTEDRTTLLDVINSLYKPYA